MDSWKFGLKLLPAQICWQIEVQRQELRWTTMNWNKSFRMDRRRSIFPSLRTTRLCPCSSCAGSVLWSVQDQLDKALSTQAWSHSWASLEQELLDVHSYLNFPMISRYIMSRSEANSFSVQAQLDKDRKTISLNWRCKDMVWTSGPRINWTNGVVVLKGWELKRFVNFSCYSQH